ncbi:MAG: UDP-N-acetylglucosamine 1-carboxyvinyltransferase [Desulfobacteraceae bacterium 4572_130]|nr:MAG: UDP-N-acetylglucosamine 1-carboxyvinyltransferase [Desulfobacteraceae bacterium 4572_130]
MDKIKIKGGNQLKGEVTISGAKNAALEDLGAKCKSKQEKIKINCSKINKTEAEYELVRKMRASILVLGPLVARFGKAKVSLPGGCAIGARPVDMHLTGLEALGAKISIKHGYIEAQANRLKGTEIYFDIPTVTGTENLMMAATLAKGTTILKNSAREPEIVALSNALKLMGAKITGAGTSVIKIKGVNSLKPAKISVIPDRIEAGTFMVAAAATRGNILIKGCEPEHMSGIIDKLKQMGSSIEIKKNQIRVKGKKTIKNINIKTLPYPGFPTDMQAQFMVLMSLAKGNSMVNETIFENRFIHVNELKRMGADISISGPNNALVRGVKTLTGASVMASDLRASASLVIAGLVAQGTTIIHRVYHIDRGYDSIEKKLSNLGADIKRIK